MQRRTLHIATTISLGLAALIFSGCTATVSPTPTAVPAPKSATDPDAEPTTESTEPGGTSTPSPTVVENVRDAVSSGDTAALASWMADSVEVALAATEDGGTLTADAAAGWVHQRFPVPGTEWDFAIDDATVDDYRDGDYARWFPEGVLVGQTVDENPQIIALTIVGDRVTQVLIAFDDVLRF